MIQTEIQTMKEKVNPQHKPTITYEKSWESKGKMYMIRERQGKLECVITVGGFKSKQSQKHIELTCGSFMRLLTNQKLEYQYTWRHSQPVTEHIMSLPDIVCPLEKYGWQVEDVSSPPNIIQIEKYLGAWQQVLNSFRVMCLVKN